LCLENDLDVGINFDRLTPKNLVTVVHTNWPWDWIWTLNWRLIQSCWRWGAEEWIYIPTTGTPAPLDMCPLVLIECLNGLQSLYWRVFV